MVINSSRLIAQRTGLPYMERATTKNLRVLCALCGYFLGILRALVSQSIIGSHCTTS